MNKNLVTAGKRFVYNLLYGGQLIHYGVKGMKWGVRRTPEELGHVSNKPKANEYSHNSNPPRSAPNSKIDHYGKDGKVDVRSFYDNEGWKNKDIHTTNHGNPKHHSYGKNGEHIHEYEWEDGRLKNNFSREISDDERKDNGDIL